MSNPPEPRPTAARARVLTSLAEIPAPAWDACANPAPSRYNPFVSHAFLSALESAGCIGRRTGWHSAHIALEGSAGATLAVMPAYLKTHSQGEYVFDHAWADAYERHGRRYYPKLQCAVPFSPVPGPRLLVPDGPDRDHIERTLAAAAIDIAGRLEASSLHITFIDEAAATRLAASPAYLHRTGQQYHWLNRGYASFDDFLADLASRKRKTVRKEREQALASGITIEHITGAEITEAHWDAMYAFYTDTGSRKWGQPYLNRQFFSALGAALADRCLLIFASRAGQYIAGALNLIGGDCLYGRYWGALEHHPCLHFEICYYQAIDYAIRHRLARVEAGAQGEHKLARGYLPTPTHSLHWIKDPDFQLAIANFLDRERAEMAGLTEAMRDLGPFRKDLAEPDDHD